MRKVAIYSRIAGTGSFVPPFRVTNEYLCRFYPGKGPQWIEEKTGVKERRHGFDYENNRMREGFFDDDLAEKAARLALEDARVSPAELDLIVRVTCTAEYLYFPDPACTLHGRLGASPDCAAYTVIGGCGGLVYALNSVDAQIRGGAVKNALIVTSNTASSFVNPTDPKTVERDWLNLAIFGDGASALVLQRSSNDGFGILACYCGASHEQDPMFYPAGGSRNPTRPDNVYDHWYRMDTRAVLTLAGPHLLYSVKRLMERYPFKLNQVNWFLFHQANLRILERLSEEIEVPMERFLINVDRYGNTAAASIGILLDEGVRSGTVKEGDLLLLGGVGAGWQYGAVLVRWGGKT